MEDVRGWENGYVRAQGPGHGRWRGAVNTPCGWGMHGTTKHTPLWCWDAAGQCCSTPSHLPPWPNKVFPFPPAHVQKLEGNSPCSFSFVGGTLSVIKYSPSILVHGGIHAF